MDIHKNARTTPQSRALIARRVTSGESRSSVARGVGVCKRTVAKWVARAAEGDLALEDRSCRPHHSPRAISAAVMVEIERLRRRWRWTGAQIAESVGVSRATAARTLRQLSLNRLASLEPPPAGRRYEWAAPGQLVHLDTKKLGRIGQIGHRITGDRSRRVRGIGWEFVHVCIDDCSRVAYAEVLPDERSLTVVAFLRRAMTWFARRGVAVQRILTDNGNPYRSRLMAAVCHARDVAQRFTRPYTPGPTARPSVSSKRCSENGPTVYRTHRRPSAPRLSRTGYTTTTGTDAIARLRAYRPLAESFLVTIS